jgi:DNA-binding response OmpR family regulator
MPIPDLTGTRVLLIEDETLVAMLLEESLAELGCEVVGPVARFDAARQAIEGERFDCALVDINLRGRPAYPLADLLDARGVPFGFVTGYDKRRLGRQVRGHPILTKPFDIRQLHGVLKGLARAGGPDNGPPYRKPRRSRA